MKMQKYLFIPIMPTPNGRFHIGHISGPYLKTDILARNLKFLGHDVKAMSGVDTYEAHVSLKAIQEGLTATELNNKYYELMLEDLSAFDIVFDSYINPLSEQHSKSFNETHQHLCDELKLNSAVTYKLEKFHKRNDGKLMTGCWIRGSCSNCGSQMKAFYCEDCGANLRPEEIINPYFIPALTNNESVYQITDTCAYIKVNPSILEKQWKVMGLDPRFIEIARTFLKKEGNKVRLTYPDTWGIEYKDPKFSEQQVMFSYTTMYFYSLYLADKYREAFDNDEKPFSIGSQVKTIAGFGIDNTNAYLVAFLGAAQGLKIKPFDYFLTNHFFQLDGKKIASSTGHAIWAADLIDKHNYPSDAARLYIMYINPQFSPNSFTLDKFDSFYKSVYLKDMIGQTDDVINFINDQGTVDVQCTPSVRLMEFFEAQQVHFSFPTPDILKAINTLLDWLKISPALSKNNITECIDWLIGVSILSHSITPALSKKIMKNFNIDEQWVEVNFQTKEETLA
ncbi:hypothetical protein BMR07_16415 [Methylococcaceae bacterium CS1]|nr:hypothetical protein BMR10_15890 [Methylococcaceae bacterium CS4]TXK97255.1 hypothetical protein BMR11_10480 [Methylococcaceae bacterium CS5]TXL02970.1 hypothetical protein BMR09_15865 [Methylococcaceae bacterium CS3]TXL02992.1 hypothetical protein BMR07_16415 [Methylococcaceae bacterium CS1]TXL06514.1 hypothetical protein BMR08_15405 [Methylococcaceae bacterium CS2]